MLATISKSQKPGLKSVSSFALRHILSSDVIRALTT